MIRNLCLGCAGFVCGVILAFHALNGITVNAQGTETGRTCDYTYIRDGSQPNIGSEGEVKYNESWRKVIDAGWTLKAIGGNAGSIYVFEKCR